MHSVINKYKNLSVPAKAAIWYMICSVLQKGISVITTPIFTRLLTTEEYGLYSVYVSWESIVVIITSMRLDYTVFNKGMSKYKSERNGYVASMQIVTTILSGICLGIYLLFRFQVNAFTELSTSVMLLIILQSFLYPSYNFWMLKERYEYRYTKFVAVVLLLTVANALLGVVAVLAARGNRGFVRIVTNVLVYVVIGAVLYFLNFKNGIRKAKLEHIKFALLFNLPLIPHYLSTYVLNQMDRIMIQKMVGAVQTGIYSVAYSAGMVMNIVSNSLINALTPWYYGKLENENIDDVKKMFLPLMVCVCTPVFIFILLAPEAMRILASQQYYEAIYIIPPIAASVIYMVLYSFFSIPEFYYDANKFSMFVSMFAAIINITTNYIFIKLFGYLAAGFTTMACHMIMALGHYVYSKKIVESKSKQKFFDFRQVIAIYVVTTLFVIIMCVLYDYMILRYILTAVLCGLAWINREKLITTFKTIKDM